MLLFRHLFTAMFFSSLWVIIYGELRFGWYVLFGDEHYEGAIALLPVSI